MLKIKLKILKIIQDGSSKVSQWAWMKRVLLLHENK